MIDSNSDADVIWGPNLIIILQYGETNKHTLGPSTDNKNHTNKGRHHTHVI